ncbi:MAG: efflux transporter periplasmic adaptor subunit [Rhodospirillales bacterium]|jgi:RND family efflux transporter MFP subunit|nr:efflux transporter periplasmic adaptor subunit [Rhodospirillales bacterium]
MSDLPLKKPNARRLVLCGTAAIAVLVAIAASGIVDRARGKQALVQWTDAQATPTVALAGFQQSDAPRTLALPGTIQPINKAAIYARVSGYLKTWQQDIGANVKAGQTLASIDTPDLDQQLDQGRADLASAEANEQLATLTAKRWHTLVASQAVAQQASDEKAGDAQAKKAVADAARANVRRLEALESFKTIAAPFDGVVTARNTDIGALINAGSGVGQELFEISDLHKLRIYVQIPQAFSAELRPGLKATFDVPQYPGRSFDATLVTMSNAMNASSRSMLVELQADNAKGELAAGTYCQVHFQLPNGGALRLPATALIPGNHGTSVAVLGTDNKAMLKPIQLGRDFGDSVEVVAGLSASDRVIDNPPETLVSGQPVQLAAAPATGDPATVAQATPTKAD